MLCGVIDSATYRRGRTSRLRRNPLADTNKLMLLLWSVPCVLAVIYAGEFVTHFAGNIKLIGWLSDYAFAFVAPRELVTSGIGGHMNSGTYGQYAPLWFGVLTSWLPLHTVLWQVAPTIVFFAMALTVGWTVAQVANRRAAALAVLMVLVASPIGLGTFMSPAVHNTTYPATVLLGAYLIWLTKAEGRRRATAIAVPVLVAIAVGVSCASDDLLIPAGMLPFFLTAALACARPDRRTKRIALTALATVSAAAPISWLTSTIMAALGFGTEIQNLNLTKLSLLYTHVQLLAEGLKLLFNGYLGTFAPGTLHTELGFGCDAVVLLAMLTMLFVAVRSTVHMTLTHRRDESPEYRAQLPTDLHIIYWTSSALGVFGSYVLSSFYDSDHLPFYATAIMSVAAVIPLFTQGRSPGRWLIPVGVSIFFAASLVGQFNDYPVIPLNTPLYYYEPDVLKLAELNHVTAGYAGYEGATSLTWNSHERLKVRPIASCPGEEAVNVCRYPHDTMESWYVPKKRHTFLLLEPIRYPTTSVDALPRGLGRPIAAYQIGSMQMYIYPYDIATRVRPILH